MRHSVQSVVRLLLILVISSSAVAGTVRPTGHSVPGEVLVRIQAGASASAVANIQQLADADDGQRLAGLKSGAAIWRLHSRSKNAEALVTALAKNPHVEYAEPNYIVQLHASPNDTFFGQLWGLKNTGQVISGSTGFAGSDIDAESAWTVTTGSSSVVVGVVDTGIDYTHPDLAANMWSNSGGKGNAACGAGTHGFNAITKTCDPMDDHDHGTHCAGTIGAVGNNSAGVTGVNWNVSIMALKFIAANGYGTTADAIAAIDFAVQAKIDGVNVRVLSNSWGGGAFSKALLDVINKANENDILFVAAAGNDSTNNDIYPKYPATYATANMISVAATENRDGMAWFSNYGPTTVHLGAPGVSVLSTTPGNSYSYFSGTSMATPHVAGVAALLLAKTPGLTTAEVKEAILDNTDPIPSLSGKTVTGGRLNAAKVLGAPVSPEFNLAISPATRSVVRGSSTTYTVTVTPSNGFNGTVALSVSGLPTGASGSFNPSSTGATSTLTVTTTNATPIYAYNSLIITGVSGNLTRTAAATLAVVTTPPTAACPQFASPALYGAATPTAVATGDFNRDGRADVATTHVNSKAITVRLGSGSGVLQAAIAYMVGTAPLGVVTGDVNGDGRLDLVVANSGSNDVSVLLGNGDGTFASAVAYGAGSSPFAVAIADFNNDSKSDLVVANNAGSDVSILTGVGDGTFNTAVDHDVASGPFGVAVGDLDRDGNADIAVADYNVGKVSILIGNGDATFASAAHYAAGAGASSVVTGDFNSDGKPDLAVSNYSSNNVSILSGNGDGTFVAAVHYPVGSGPYAVAAGDFNGDGKSDLVATNGNSSTVSILMGTGSGFQAALQHTTGGYEPNHVSVADFNGDGKLDFVVANTGYHAIAVILNQGVCSASCNVIAGAVHYPVSGTPFSLTAGDFNRDGNVDMAAAARVTNSVSLTLGNGDGTFTAGVVMSAGTNPDSVIAGDFNRDGSLDLVAANSGSGNVSVLLGNGNGTFASAVHYTAGTTPRAVATADFNRDGKPDLVVSTAGTNGVAVLLGNGDGTFQAAVQTAAGTTPFFAAPGDFNRDGKVDLAVANAGSANVSILIGNGDGTFQPATNFAVGTAPRAIVVHDFDRNGKPDLAVSNATSNNVSVLLGNGDGTFQAAVHYTAGTSPVSLTAGDFNDDGVLDLGVANTGSNNVHILVGDGAGAFTGAVIVAGGNGPAGIVAADVNRDGKADLAVSASSSGSVVILRNTCPSPDLSVTKTHSGSFAQGSNGKTYSIVVKNSGSTATTGPVNATDTLPGGLTATAISGAGWTCTLATLTCTRSDVLAAGASYPAITLTVNVASNAPATLTNVVNVNGGGELNTVNNSASDPTTITPVTDLTVIKSHLGSFAQGATGKTYTLLVRNAGSLATSGTVTVVDTIPTGLTITSLAGTGWTCTKANGTCTRSDVLAGGSTYPPITVTVNVAANAPPSVINTATVSGGGQSNTSNDTAADPTVIWAAQTCGSFGAPTFYDSGSYPTDIAVGNLNGDSSPDLAVANYYSGIAVLLGKPDGTFHAPVTVSTSYPRSIELADLNNDGKTDAIAASSSMNTISVLLGNGDGTFATPVSYAAGSYTRGFAVGDFNGDGNRDVAASNEYAHQVTILLGNGNGTLQGGVTYAAGAYPFDVEVSDVDLNGTSDLVVATGDNDGSILLGNGDGSFGAPISIDDTYGGLISVAEVNQDGKPDLLVAAGDELKVFAGNGDGTFQASVDFATNSYYPRSIIAEDLNGDGKTDVVISSDYYNDLSILRGKGDGTFEAAVNQYVNGGSDHMALADFNADGRPDLAVAGDYSDDLGIMLGGCGDLSITKSHDGNFIYGQSGAYYELSVKNSGAGVSTGTVTVTDVLPDGLTATSIYGSGWTCTLQTLTCTRSTSLSPGQSYPTIYVYVSIDSDAPANVVNTATVSGGNDNNTANNTTIDPTIIQQVPDLTITKTHNGMFAQGQTGRTYSIVISNGGAAATSGTVSVTDYVPFGLSATDMTGVGWNCVLGTRTCTRTDALAGGASYPAISLTVNVASNAPSYVYNNAYVTGGGEDYQSTFNNYASDFTPILGTPENLSATASSTSQVNLFWTGVSYSTAYEVYRSQSGVNGPWVLIATPTSNGLTDYDVLANKSYLYRVRAVASPITVGPFSNVDLATTLVFTDDPIIAGTTTMKAVHITELRTAVNAVRGAAGLAPAGFTTPSLTAGSPILAVHWTELRTGLDQARSALGLLPIVYADKATAGSTVNAAHIRDLRAGVK